MRWKTFLLTAVPLLALDQLTKALVRPLPLGEPVVLVPGLLWLTHLENTGASFSMLQGRNALLIIVSLAALFFLYKYRKEFLTTGKQALLGLLATGILGNLTDRILFGSVTDFLDLGWWPVFNVADSCLVIGVAALVLHDVRSKLQKPPIAGVKKKKQSKQLKSIGKQPFL